MCCAAENEGPSFHDRRLTHPLPCFYVSIIQKLVMEAPEIFDQQIKRRSIHTLISAS